MGKYTVVLFREFVPHEMNEKTFDHLTKVNSSLLAQNIGESGEMSTSRAECVLSVGK